MNMRFKPLGKRKLVSALFADLADNLRDHATIQHMRELLEKQLADYEVSLPAKSYPLDQAADWLEQIQARVNPQLCSNLSSQSPWFGTLEKRLTGLNSATLFIPLDADQLAEKYSALTWQQHFESLRAQSSQIKDQIQRKVDRMTGVRAKTDIWETVFPEDQ